MIKKMRKVLLALLLLCLILSGCAPKNVQPEHQTTQIENYYISNYKNTESIDFRYVFVNENIPDFTQDDYTTEPFEIYSELDELGRCGVAYANICLEIMPTEERDEIGSVTPTGWHSVKYDCVDGKYLYNRCHLIGFQLAGENANEKNLITGTRSMNVDGMLPFENMVDDYIEQTNNHVLYRVTPVYEDDNLLADGVQMEAWSVEDDGKGICFNIFVYNIQEGVHIDYETGESWLIPDYDSETSQATEQTYILNTNTKKYHLSSCSSAQDMNESNKQKFHGTEQELSNQGYEPCGRCIHK